MTDQTHDNDGHCRHCDGRLCVALYGGLTEHANISGARWLSRCPACAESERAAAVIRSRTKNLIAKIDAHSGSPGEVDWEMVSLIDGLAEAEHIINGSPTEAIEREDAK